MPCGKNLLRLKANQLTDRRRANRVQKPNTLLPNIIRAARTEAVTSPSTANVVCATPSPAKLAAKLRGFHHA